MKLIQKIFREVLIDFVTKAFTLDNLKIARDLIIQRLRDAAKQTDTQIDDYSVALLERILNDENIVKIYQFILDNVGIAVDGTGLCKAAEPIDLNPLALAIADEETGENCCAICLSGLLKVLEVLMPLLIDWYLNGK